MSESVTLGDMKEQAADLFMNWLDRKGLLKDGHVIGKTEDEIRELADAFTYGYLTAWVLRP
jgi:hypothetical protein